MLNKKEPAIPSGKKAKVEDLVTPRGRSRFIQRIFKILKSLRALPAWISYLLSTAIVLAFFAVRWFFRAEMPESPYLVSILAIILVSLLFDMWTGSFAVVLSGALDFYFFTYHGGSLIGFTIYILVGLFTALIVDALRDSIDQLDLIIRNLAESNERLEESNERLDEFTHIVSHDLKEPIRGIDTLSSFLLEDYKDALGQDGQEKLDRLKSLSARMQEMISDLLIYSKAGQGKGLEKVDVHAVLLKVLELMRLQIEQDKVNVAVADDLPAVTCSRVHIGEIFRNLITNGIKYNTSAQKKIEVGSIRGHFRHPDGDVFFVRDNGIGIPDELKEDIFKMFRRLHGKDKFGGGTGSGLPIARKLVEQHHGEIWVEPNEDGVGSTFCFYVDDETASLHHPAPPQERDEGAALH